MCYVLKSTGSGLFPKCLSFPHKARGDVKNPAGKDARAFGGFLGEQREAGFAANPPTLTADSVTSQPMAPPEAVGHAPWEQRPTAPQGHLPGSWEPCTSPCDPLFICKTLRDETGPTELGVASGKNVTKAPQKESATEKEPDPRSFPYHLPFNLLLLRKTTASHQRPREEIQVSRYSINCLQKGYPSLGTAVPR